jgi:hypothetical protein
MATKTPVKLIAGIVPQVVGQLKHIKQLVEYITGMDTRIGYPNEHLQVIQRKNFQVHYTPQQ